jgi:chloride channel protein, CIC family
MLFFVYGKTVLHFLGSYYVILIPALGGLIIGPIINIFAKETKGHGVPEVMLAVTTLGGRIRPRVAAIKALASSICIGSGGSAGREGPIVQIGSAIGSSLGQLFQLTEDKVKILVACGAAGGISATFNTPLAGIFFSLEIILRQYALRHFSAVVLSAVTTTIISRTFLGNHPAFPTPPYEMLSAWEIPLYLIFGFIAAGVAFLFVRTLYKIEDKFDQWQIPDYLKPALGGLLVGLIGLYFPQIFGVGYETIEQVLYGKMAISIILVIIFLKLLATSLTLGSGGSCGVFSPSLFIGASLGAVYGSLTQLLFPTFGIHPGACALVGMGAVFAGAAHAPISAILILFEMTGDYKIILPLMITCIISTVVVRRLSKESVYTLKLMRRGIDIQKEMEMELIETIKVADAMYTDIITVKDDTSVRNVGLLIKSSHHRGFPVKNSTGDLVGIVTYKDINQALAEGKGEIPVQEIMICDVLVCYPGENLRNVFEKLGERNIGRLPVVERNNSKHLVGLMTRKNIISAYYYLLKKEEDKV